MTRQQWIDRSPSAYSCRAIHRLPEWCRWPVAWVALCGAMMMATLVVADVFTAALR